MREFSLIFYFIVALLSGTSALPKERFTRDNDGGQNIVGVATNVITSSILKGTMDSDSNYVFSPFGFSSILAMLSEGATGQTYDEISNVLKYPSDKPIVRQAYCDVLKRLQGDNPQSDPQFKTWFYIYKNNTVNSDFRNILAESYHVEVKDIDRNDYDFDVPKTSVSISTEDEDHNNSKDIVGFEMLKQTDPAHMEDLKSVAIDTKFDEVIEDENPKFDKNIDDKEYVESIKIKEEIAKEKDDLTNEVLDDDLAEMKLKEKIENKKQQDEPVEKSDAPVKMSLSLKKLEDEEHEIMHAVESHTMRRRFYMPRAYLNGDIASALSGNSLVGKKTNTAGTDGSENESKMLLFNGLYYRGSWAIPFQQLRAEENVFYTNTDDKPVVMMRSRGIYKFGSDDALDSKIIELPYNNSRYSLLMIVPNTRDGLKNLIKKFDVDTLKKVTGNLVSSSVQTSIPKFRIETTSRAEKALAKLGMTTVFTSKADLSGIAGEQNIHVDELVQHVSIRVDEGASSENALSATNTVRSDPASDEKFIADKPFLFFVRDVVDDVVIVAGKITDVPLLEE